VTEAASEESETKAGPGTSDATNAMIPWGEENNLERITEIIATVLLAMATVTAAWCAFESAKWSGVQANSFSAAGATRTESTRASTEAGQLQSIDVTLFTQWLAAKASDEEVLSDFYEERFRLEFQPAFEEWVASDPLKNEDAAKSPFALSSYVLNAEIESERLQSEADGLSATAREANGRSDNYVLATVMFAAVLFFAGVSTKLQTPVLRIVVLGSGVVLFLVTGAAVATFPIEF
jgi:hypothetical protein